jgi:ribonuclease HI
MEMQNWKIDFDWIKAHTGNHEDELADQLTEEAEISREIN